MAFAFCGRLYRSSFGLQSNCRQPQLWLLGSMSIQRRRWSYPEPPLYFLLHQMQLKSLYYQYHPNLDHLLALLMWCNSDELSEFIGAEPYFKTDSGFTLSRSDVKGYELKSDPFNVARWWRVEYNQRVCFVRNPLESAIPTASVQFGRIQLFQ